MSTGLAFEFLTSEQVEPFKQVDQPLLKGVLLSAHLYHPHHLSGICRRLLIIKDAITYTFNLKCIRWLPNKLLLTALLSLLFLAPYDQNLELK